MLLKDAVNTPDKCVPCVIHGGRCALGPSPQLFIAGPPCAPFSKQRAYRDENKLAAQSGMYVALSEDKDVVSERSKS